MNREIARECLTIAGRKTDEAEIERFMEEVKQGVPVLPVTFVCDALREWAKLYGEPHAEERYEGENAKRKKLSDDAFYVFTQIVKSNLLSRMIYGGEKPREKPCPHHKGRWSGCRLPEDTECKGACMYGSNVTGWLR